MFNFKKREMEYSEAIKESFKKPWKVVLCDEGEKCWCRMIELKQPIKFTTPALDGVFEHELRTIISQGAIDEETAKYLVNLHNLQFNN